MTLHGVLIGLGIAVAIWLLVVAALFAFGRASAAKAKPAAKKPAPKPAAKKPAAKKPAAKKK